MRIEQKHYPDIEIDTKEKDIIQIWQYVNEESNVIQIEREKLYWLIAELEKLEL